MTHLSPELLLGDLGRSAALLEVAPIYKRQQESWDKVPCTCTCTCTYTCTCTFTCTCTCTLSTCSPRCYGSCPTCSS